MSFLRLCRMLLLQGALVMKLNGNVAHGKGFFQCTKIDTEKPSVTTHKLMKTSTDGAMDPTSNVILTSTWSQTDTSRMERNTGHGPMFSWQVEDTSSFPLTTSPTTDTTPVTTITTTSLPPSPLSSAFGTTIRVRVTNQLTSDGVTKSNALTTTRTTPIKSPVTTAIGNATSGNATPVAFPLTSKTVTTPLSTTERMNISSKSSDVTTNHWTTERIQSSAVTFPLSQTGTLHVGTTSGTESMPHEGDTTIVTSTKATTTTVTTPVTTDATTTPLATTVATTFSTKIPVSTPFATSPVRFTASVTTLFSSSTPVSTSFTTVSPSEAPITTPATTVTTPSTTPVTTSFTTASASKTSVTTLATTATPSTTPVTTSFTTVSPSTAPITTSETTAIPSTTPVTTSFTTVSPSKTSVTTSETTAFSSTRPVTTSTSTITTIKDSNSYAQSSDETTDLDITPSSTCPNNMVLRRCTCQPTCADPYQSHGCHFDCLDPFMMACICPDGFYLEDGNHCVPPQQCGCYLYDVGVIPSGEFHVKSDCSVCICDEGYLSCGHQCSSNAVCVDISGIESQCSCKAGFYGNGVNCTRFHDCEELFVAGYTTEGVYLLKPFNWHGTPFDVYCKEGWMVLQRRVNGSVEFNRNWNSYKEGFGDPDNEVWLGNDRLSFFTNIVPHQLRIDLETAWSTNNSMYPISIVWHYLTYDGFQISDESTNYVLSYDITSFGGTLEYDYMAYHHDSNFTTFDRDNDIRSNQNCAERHNGGWWFKSCYASNLNGEYGRQGDTGICLLDRSKPVLETFCNITFTEMTMRPMNMEDSSSE